MWEGIWNHAHLVILNICLERLHYVTISHDQARWNRCCQSPELFTKWKTVNHYNQDNGIRNLSESTWFQEFKFSCRGEYSWFPSSSSSRVLLLSSFSWVHLGSSFKPIIVRHQCRGSIIEVVYLSICNEGIVETIKFSSFNSVILNKFNLYKSEDQAYILK